MKGYDELNNNELIEIQKTIYSINASINKAIQYSKESKTVSKVDLESLNTILYQMMKYLEKLKGLNEADGTAYAMLGDVKTDILNYATAVGSVKIGNTSSSFYNLGNRDVAYYSQTGHYVDGKFVEWNTAWGGNNLDDNGCGPTAYAIALATVLQDDSITPETIANEMSSHGWVSSGGEFIRKLSESHNVNCTNKGLDINMVEETLKNGGVFIASVNRGGHYSTLTDVVYQDGKRYFVKCDPYPQFIGEKEDNGHPVLISEETAKLEFGWPNASMGFYITPSNVMALTAEGKYVPVDVVKV